MKCSKCGRDVEDGKLFCPVCGTEIQWVPEYNTLETILQQQQIKEQEKLQQKKMHEEYLQRKKKRRTRKKKTE